ncbi:MAG TPA: hypothetical protein PKJ19_12630, partial [Flavobacteriales bacterium]|nr:hypothetical protein [Flavobacteriales bacterium]
ALLRTGLPALGIPAAKVERHAVAGWALINVGGTTTLTACARERPVCGAGHRLRITGLCG